MPELPEVETVCRGLRAHLVGRRIRELIPTVARLRSRLDAAALQAAAGGRTVKAVRRRAKYILIELDDLTALVLHLGMTGSFHVTTPTTPLLPHDRILFRLSDGREVRLNDPRRFSELRVERLTAPGADPAGLGHIGPEPLSDAFDADVLHTLTRRRKTRIKSLLLDQALIAGIGNIYASEALWRARIRPNRRATTLTRAECAALAAGVRSVLTAAVEHGGTTIINFKTPDGIEGAYWKKLDVYDRSGQPCHRCGAGHPIRRTVLAGRSTFHCPHCQR